MRHTGLVAAAIVFGVLAARTADAGQPTEDRSWLEAGEALVQAAEAGGAGVEEKPEYVHWSRRVGPAYPDDNWRSFGRWAKELPETFWDDTKATFTNKFSLTMLTAAVAAGAAVHCGGADSKAEDHYEKHGSCLNSFWDTVGDVGGNPGTHFAVAGAMYFTALARHDNVNYEKSKTLINALALNGLVTLALKGIVHSEVPNGREFGWPSGHTSSSFCFATVMYNEYGPWVGIPCFAFAGFVGYERVDARNHDLSDVVSGALIGIAIGHAVCRNHEERLEVLGMDVVPWTDPSRNGIGIALAKSW